MWKWGSVSSLPYVEQNSVWLSLSVLAESRAQGFFLLLFHKLNRTKTAHYDRKLLSVLLHWICVMLRSVYYFHMGLWYRKNGWRLFSKSSRRCSHTKSEVDNTYRISYFCHTRNSYCLTQLTWDHAWIFVPLPP